MVFLSVSLTLGVVFAECSPFCSCGGQLYHRGERSQGEGSYVPLGSGGGGEPGPLRLHQAQNHAHVSGLLEVHVCWSVSLLMVVLCVSMVRIGIPFKLGDFCNSSRLLLLCWVLRVNLTVCCHL